MSTRDAFLRALAENEDDHTARLVYADWLDEEGEHEEADRQRKWPAAKEWLVKFSSESSRYEVVSYQGLIEFGHRVIKELNSEDRVYFDNADMWGELREHSQEFWSNWSVVTGVALPPGLAGKGFHTWRCCSHEVYYWFGTPDADDPEE